MSTSGNARTVSAAPSAVPLSATSGSPAPIASIARETVSSLRPLTMTRAPSRASDVAIAWPIPAVEAVTSAVLPSSSRSIAVA